ncbi:hypothetical protein [Marinomonas spartinae]|uniref:hypothetical protein n=1 Tax=Marinomonas spartinae TaxID=1792290 RepID=UPI0018F22F5C|nr:hypothetical protein [Marinomonas spartinae]MBJ7555473.1 hypothetical protein [Marinomonas spartinae]
MDKIKAMILRLIGRSSMASAKGDMQYYPSPNGAFGLVAPVGWLQKTDSDFLSISSPDGSVSITANAFTKNDGNLEEFAEYRFWSLQGLYTPQSEVSPIKYGVLREYESAYPSESEKTYYVTAAVQVRNAFVGMAVVTSRKDYNENKSMYIKVFESIKVNL